MSSRAKNSANPDSRKRVEKIGTGASSPSATGYSGTPLAKKLGIVEGSRVHVVGAPADYRQLLSPVPAGVQFVRTVDDSVDVVHLFVTERAALVDALSALRAAIRPDAAVWVSWPKKTREKGVAPIPTDVVEDTVREIALPMGYVDVKVCAVDATWSGLKMVIRVENRPKER